MSTIPILKLGSTGERVKQLQRKLGQGLVVDGELGPMTWRAWRAAFVAGGGHGFTGSTTRARRRWIVVVTPADRTDREKARAKKLAAEIPLRERAYRVASHLIGIMEKGGNNRGPEVEQIIRSGGGRVGDPWCGWFLAHCYKVAGSVSVAWQWGSVRLWLPLTGIRKTTAPLRGDAVRFVFDHIGMFVRFVRRVAGKWVTCTRAEASHIETVEGNTGTSGAVSDSASGGDGVYRKVRLVSQVRDFVEVLR